MTCERQIGLILDMATPTTSRKPASDAQLAHIDRLQQKALLNDDDYWTYNERLAERLGFTTTYSAREGQPEITVADTDALKTWWESTHGDRIDSRTASVCIEILKALGAESRCEGYCRQRGTRHSKVHYYDGHYDWECGLS